MARQKGANSFAGNLEVLAGAPLDARAIVPTKADLTVAANFSYSYVGMIVSVQGEGKAYMLKAKPTTSAENWVEIGSGSSGADNVVEGYYNATDGKFYEESTYTTEITGESNVIYISLDTDKAYYFDGTNFKRIDDEDKQYTTLPSPTSDLVGEVYQYVGTTGGGFTNGYFYTVIEDPDNPGTYIWVQKNVQPDADTKIQVETIPTATSTLEGTIVQYVGATDANYTNGYFYECIEDPDNVGSYIWVQKNIQPDVDTKIQVESMPTPTSAIEGEIVQFVGTTTADYIHAYFYECIEDPDTAGTYIWVQRNIQPDNDTSIQYETMPTATSADEDKIVQYIGDTTSTYTNGYFYKCVEDSSTTPSTYKWEAITVQAGGSASLGRNITVAVDVGGIEAGDTFAAGTSYDDIWDALLNPTLYPTYVEPSAVMTYSVDSYYEVGATVPAKTLSFSYDPGSININGTKQNNRAGAAITYEYYTMGADSEKIDSSETESTFNVPAITRSTKGTILMKGQVYYDEGPQPKDSKGNNYETPLPAGAVFVSKTMTFIQAYFYGKSATSTIADFTGLTKSVTAKGQKQFKFTTNNEYMVMAYDSAYGNLSSILDSNGFETISGWTKSTLTVNGFSYYVYVSNSPTTDTNAQFTFKY